MKYRYYEDIVEAKEIVREAMEKVVDERLRLTMQNCICIPEYRKEALHSLACWFRTAETMRKRIALFTVVGCGFFDEDTQSFLMPATKDCCESYRFTRLLLRHNEAFAHFLGDGKKLKQIYFK